MHFEQRTIDPNLSTGPSHPNHTPSDGLAARTLHNSAKIDPQKLAFAYEYCRTISWKHAKTFYFATHFLPAQKRPPVYAVYALCRYVDDLVDRSEEGRKALTKEKIAALLNQWRTDLELCYSGVILDNPIMLAWYDMLQRYAIPKSLPLELIDGVCMDLAVSRYQTFEELYVYCYKVASVVGLMTSEIFGYSSKEALSYAVKLGIAMQLTNILRDVGEDARKGRIYLPLEDLARFNYTEEDLFRSVLDERFIALMKFQIARARRYYDDADAGIPLLSKDSRLAVRVSSVNYRKILERIEKNRYDVFSRRAFVSLTGKLISLPYLWISTALS
ncbi:MAG: phytoene/squalene synthase family protein [Chloroherpetonaceae bacterium]|nr:phytoene/squalene synthase family protein [Chloroherpetonaceae bacterium]MCS7210431.1 phytoene/squalene synthase family protein [Chloroherpetonaceae bacterium]MDW8019298.1 phytoene/squalene synthase family protein [Chloroherpetonaceae bacterium]MDW8466971.1 phytoene/squalene synthase family protein [Chloroherpetonaceae bacterium]